MADDSADVFVSDILYRCNRDNCFSMSRLHPSDKKTQAYIHFVSSIASVSTTQFTKSIQVNSQSKLIMQTIYCSQIDFLSSYHTLFSVFSFISTITNYSRHFRLFSLLLSDLKSFVTCFHQTNSLIADLFFRLTHKTASCLVWCRWLFYA